MSPAKWRPLCLSLNVLMEVDYPKQCMDVELFSASIMKAP